MLYSTISTAFFTMHPIPFSPINIIPYILSYSLYFPQNLNIYWWTVMLLGFFKKVFCFIINYKVEVFIVLKDQFTVTVQESATNHIELYKSLVNLTVQCCSRKRQNKSSRTDRLVLYISQNQSFHFLSD